MVNLLQRTIEALLFYHPVVWWASRWVRLEREHCCDALVLSHDHTPQSYAETLATLALPELAPQFATAAMANHQLTSRICHILNVEERTMTVSIRTLIGGIVLISAGVGGFLLATLRTDSAAADDPVPSAVAEPEERDSETEGRLMFGIGVNSDAGVVGTILLEDESESLLGLNADGGQAIGTSLQEWGRRAWSADEATGPPDVPEAGDNEQAWASLTEDGQVEWLRLRYDEPVPTAAIMVYESFNPGALIRVTSVDSEGAEVVIWEGEDPVAVRDGKGVAVVIPNQALELDRITLHLDSPKVAGWNEIDAVGLIDRFTGQVHWADSAEASSSYADHGAHTQADYHEFYHFFSRHDGTAIDKACQRCHRAHAGSATRREWIQQLRAELQRLEAELALEDATREPQELESQWRHPEAELAEEEREALLRWLQEGADNQFDETAQTAEEAYRDWVRRLFNKPEPVVDAGGGQEPDDATGEADRLEELRRTLQAQQQAIEELTELLQQLQHRLTPADDAGDAGTEADADDLGGNDINIPGVGPTPEAIDFAFPIEPNNVIDEFILQRLNGAGIEDAGEMTDEEFLRRIFLDLMGRLPTVEETRQYLENKSPEARQELIDELLQSEETADNWGKAWSFYVGLER